MKEFIIDPEKPDKKILTYTASGLAKGNIIAFPTDTVYGLGANIYNELAIQKIFRIKGRPKSKALIAMIYGEKQLDELVSSIPEAAIKLMEAFWPGALTLIFPALDNLPPSTTRSGGIGIRMPASKIARELVRISDSPMATTSANRTGFKSITAGYQVKTEIGKGIDILLDGGRIDGGEESSIVDIRGENPIILRAGVIKEDEIINILKRD